MIKPMLVLLLTLPAIPTASRSVEDRIPAAVTSIDTSGQGSINATGTRPPSPKTPLPGWHLIQWLQKFTPNGGWPGSAWWDRDEVYISFERRNCQRTLYLARLTGSEDGPIAPLSTPRRILYEGAAAACLAAFHGRSDLWPVAESRLGHIRGTGLSCWDLAVLRIFREIVTAHHADPTARFIQGQGTSPACVDRCSRDGVVRAAGVRRWWGSR